MPQTNLKVNLAVIFLYFFTVVLTIDIYNPAEY